MLLKHFLKLMLNKILLQWVVIIIVCVSTCFVILSTAVPVAARFTQESSLCEYILGTYRM